MSFYEKPVPISIEGTEGFEKKLNPVHSHEKTNAIERNNHGSKNTLPGIL